MREKVSIKCKQLMISDSVQYRKARIYIIIIIIIIIIVLSFLLFIKFLYGKKNVYTPNQGTKREKYFNHIIHSGKNANFGGK